MSTSDKIVTKKEGRVGYLIFNNPERHNAVSLEMWETVARVLKDFEQDKEIGVVVLTGAGGKAFVSGADISKFEDERATLEAVDRYNDAVEHINSRSTRSQANRRDGPRLLHRGRPRPCGQLRHSDCGGSLALLAAGGKARARLRISRGKAFGRRGRSVLCEGNLLHRPPIRRAGGARDAARNRVVPDADIEGYVKE